MAMLLSASAPSPMQRQGGGDQNYRENWPALGAHGNYSVPPPNQHGSHRQSPSGNPGARSSPDINGNGPVFGGRPDVWIEPGHNQGFYQQNQAAFNKNNNNVWVIPPNSNDGARTRSYQQHGGATEIERLLATMHRMEQRFLQREQMFVQQEEKWTFKWREREVQFENRLRDMHKNFQESLLLVVDTRVQQKLEELEKERSSGDRGQQGQPKRIFRPIKLVKSEQTPLVNDYLDKCEQLDNARNNNESLALEGAKVQFEEHYGQDIIEAPEKVLAHAVAADLWMSKGAARAMRTVYGKPKVNFELQPGDIAITKAKGKTVYNLVTKVDSPDKLHKDPETFLRNVKKSFVKLAEEIEKAKLEDIGMTFLCSGIDRMHRLWVMNELYVALKDVNVKVKFYNKTKENYWKGSAQLFASRQGSDPVNEREGGVVDGEGDSQGDGVGNASGVNDAVILQAVNSGTEVQPSDVVTETDEATAGAGSAEEQPTTASTETEEEQLSQQIVDRSHLKRACEAREKLNL